MRLARLAVLAGFAAIVLAAPAQAATVDEVLKVPTKYGRMWVEIRRPTGMGKVPIILTLSPYNSVGVDNPAGTVAADGLASTFNPKGYARAVADVLGTRNSTGCWDYGGPREQESGVDVVNALAAQPWSNGKVAMVGTSYDGTTANMVAVRGADVPGLAAIAPQAAINHWYGYAYQDGVRYFGNSKEPSDEGIDTPLGFDFGIVRTPPTKPDTESILDLPTGRYNPCDSVQHTQYGYDTTPDYDQFWLDRDYRKDAANVRVPVLLTHGWQDYNVKQSEGLDFYNSLPNSLLKILYMWQGPHGLPGTKDYNDLLARFFDYTLKGVQNGLETEPRVHTVGRTGTKADSAPKLEAAWPPVGTSTLALRLGRTDAGGVLASNAGGAPATYTDSGTGSEERALEEGVAEEDGWLYYATEPLAAPMRIAGSAILSLSMFDSADHGQISPTLVDVAPDGTAVPIARGHLNLLYRNGLDHSVAVPAGELLRARVRFSPQDQTIPAGHRLGLVLESSNVVWALADQPTGYDITVRHGESVLKLPVVG